MACYATSLIAMQRNVGFEMLPAHLEISGLIRSVEAAGGFGTVLAVGEREVGTILVVLVQHGMLSQAYERVPSVDAGRHWRRSKEEIAGDSLGFHNYLERRKSQDVDLWIVELDIADGERFIGLM